VQERQGGREGAREAGREGGREAGRKGGRRKHLKSCCQLRCNEAYLTGEKLYKCLLHLLFMEYLLVHSCLSVCASESVR